MALDRTILLEDIGHSGSALRMTNRNPVVSSAQEALKGLASKSNIFIHGGAAVPLVLVEELCSRVDLRDLFTYHIHLGGHTRLGSVETPHISPHSFFTGPSLREAVRENRAHHIPIFLSDIPALFTSGSVQLDMALIQVSPPDSHGFCSLGTSVDCARAAADSAKVVIAEINHQMPRTFGNSSVHISDINFAIEVDRPLIGHPPKPLSATDLLIGKHISELVPDGATLQVGIGAIPDAALSHLHGKSDLGVHTEMFSDYMVDLAESGAISNRLKSVHPGRIVTSFVTGSKKVYDFVDNNPIVEFHGCDRTNDTSLIRKNPNVVAINSALQIDLTGQVCADSIGFSIYSGIGGQMDFIRGAALSKGGKPIIALPSTAQGGTISRIVPSLLPGAGVVTTRGHVHWVVTEFGAVNLHGKSTRERQELLISIAHPDFRDELNRAL